MFARFQLGLGNALSALFQMDRNQPLRSMFAVLLIAIVMDLTSNTLYEALALPFWAAPLIFAAILLGTVLWFGWRSMTPPAVAPPAEVQDLPAYPGLVLFLSLFNARGDQQESGARGQTWRRKELKDALDADPVDWPIVLDRVTHSNMAPILAAMRHHMAGGTLKHVWLISTLDVTDKETGVQEGSQRLAPLLKRIIKEGLGWAVEVHYEEPMLQIHPHDTTGSYKAVEYIYEQAAARVGLDVSAVIADFTGGRAPMTAGMVLACSPRDWPMQYTTTQRDPAKPGPTGEPRPVGVDVHADDLLLCALDAVRRRVDRAA